MASPSTVLSEAFVSEVPTPPADVLRYIGSQPRLGANGEALEDDDDDIGDSASNIDSSTSKKKKKKNTSSKKTAAAATTTTTTTSTSSNTKNNKQDDNIATKTLDAELAAVGAGAGSTPATHQQQEDEEEQDADAIRIALEADFVKFALESTHTLEDIKDFVEQQKVNINAVDSDGTTALMAVCESVRPDTREIVLYLLENGADVNHVQQKFSWTALLGACNKGNLTAVEAMFTWGSATTPPAIPDVFHKDFRNLTCSSYVADLHSMLSTMRSDGFMYESQEIAYHTALDAHEDDPSIPFDEQLFMSRLPKPQPGELTIADRIDSVCTIAEYIAKYSNMTVEQVLDSPLPSWSEVNEDMESRRGSTLSSGGNMNTNTDDDNEPTSWSPVVARTPRASSIQSSRKSLGVGPFSTRKSLGGRRKSIITGGTKHEDDEPEEKTTNAALSEVSRRLGTVGSMTHPSTATSTSGVPAFARLPSVEYVSASAAPSRTNSEVVGSSSSSASGSFEDPIPAPSSSSKIPHPNNVGSETKQAAATKAVTTTTKASSSSSSSGGVLGPKPLTPIGVSRSTSTTELDDNDTNGYAGRSSIEKGTWDPTSLVPIAFLYLSAQLLCWIAGSSL